MEGVELISKETVWRGVKGSAKGDCMEGVELISKERLCGRD
jgi:hypothetical protein